MSKPKIIIVIWFCLPYAWFLTQTFYRVMNGQKWLVAAIGTVASIIFLVKIILAKDEYLKQNTV